MTETAIEELRVPDDLSDELKTHWVCGVCYPEVMSSSDVIRGDCKSVCGKDLLGILAPPDTDMCAECKSLQVPHWIEHINNGDVTWEGLE